MFTHSKIVHFIQELLIENHNQKSKIILSIRNPKQFLVIAESKAQKCIFILNSDLFSVSVIVLMLIHCFKLNAGHEINSEKPIESTVITDPFASTSSDNSLSVNVAETSNSGN